MNGHQRERSVPAARRRALAAATRARIERALALDALQRCTQSVLRSDPSSRRAAGDVEPPSNRSSAVCVSRGCSRCSPKPVVIGNDVERRISRPPDVTVMSVGNEPRVRSEAVERDVPDAAARECRACDARCAICWRLARARSRSARYESGASSADHDLVERDRCDLHARAARDDRDVVLLERAEARRDEPAAVESRASVVGLRPVGAAAAGAAGRRRTPPLRRRDSAGARRRQRGSQRLASRSRLSPRRLREQRSIASASSSRPSPVTALNGITCSASSARARATRGTRSGSRLARELVDLRQHDDRRHTELARGNRASAMSSFGRIVARRRAAARSRAAAALVAGTPRSAGATRPSLLGDPRVAVPGQVDEHELRR